MTTGPPPGSGSVGRALSSLCGDSSFDFGLGMTEPRLKLPSPSRHSPSGFITESQLLGDLGHLVTQRFHFTEKTEAQRVK